jgi:hypothetical protein
MYEQTIGKDMGNYLFHFFSLSELTQSLELLLQVGQESLSHDLLSLKNINTHT